MSSVVTFGEVMLRLKAPGFERLLQSPALEATFGGAEANVAVSLARFGTPAAFVSAIPANAIGDACLGELRRHGVDTSRVLRRGERLGLYFLEAGANQRASKVTYDRAGSAISQLALGDVDWRAVLAGARWFHVTGVTAAISQSAADACIDGARTAHEMGLTVSCDLNFRANLWKYGRTAPEVMRELLRHADVAVANEEDCEKSLGVRVEGASSTSVDADRYRLVAERVLDAFPNLTHVAITLRESLGASRNGWSACLHDRTTFRVAPSYAIDDIVDRVGAGDAFAAGLIHALLATPADPERALGFATAASCLKHSILGDFNLVSVAEVEALMRGEASGRVQR